MRSSTGDEDCITQKLDNGVPLDVVLLEQTFPQLLVQVPALIVDGIMVGLDGLALLFGHLQLTNA